jgi:tetratricopeptide (TPR) repeat protein
MIARIIFSLIGLAVFTFISLMIYGMYFVGDADRCSISQDYRRAIEACDRVLTSEDLSTNEISRTRLNRGRAYAQAGEHYNAIKDFDQALADRETIAELEAVALDLRGQSWFEVRQFERAAQDASEAIRIDGTNAFLFNNRGAANLYLKNYSRLFPRH